MTYDEALKKAKIYTRRFKEDTVVIIIEKGQWGWTTWENYLDSESIDPDQLAWGSWSSTDYSMSGLFECAVDWAESQEAAHANPST